MALDARPFRTLRTPSGGTIRAEAPKLIPLANGIRPGSQGVTADAPTHTIVVFVALGNPPADLKENAKVEVDVLPGEWQTFRILRNGIDRQAGTWKLYVRAEAAGEYRP